MIYYSILDVNWWLPYTFLNLLYKIVVLKLCVPLRGTQNFLGATSLANNPWNKIKIYQSL